MTFGNLRRKLNTFGVAGAVTSKPKGIIMSEVKTYILHDRFCAVNATKVPHFVDFLHYVYHNCIGYFVVRVARLLNSFYFFLVQEGGLAT